MDISRTSTPSVAVKEDMSTKSKATEVTKILTNSIMATETKTSGDGTNPTGKLKKLSRILKVKRSEIASLEGVVLRYDYRVPCTRFYQLAACQQIIEKLKFTMYVF